MDIKLVFLEKGRLSIVKSNENICGVSGLAWSRKLKIQPNSTCISGRKLQGPATLGEDVAQTSELEFLLRKPVILGENIAESSNDHLTGHLTTGVHFIG
jgi:hypothetical protein